MMEGSLEDLAVVLIHTDWSQVARGVQSLCKAAYNHDLDVLTFLLERN